MSPSSGGRLVVVLAVPAVDPSPVPTVPAERLAAALLADAVDAAESLAATRVAVLCTAAQAVDVTGTAAFDTTVWSSPRPSVAAAADHAAAADADQVVVMASDAPHLPGLLIGKVFRALARSDAVVSPDPRGPSAAIGLRLPVPDWVGDDVDLDESGLADRLIGRAPRRALVRSAPGWRRLRDRADFAALHSTVEGADLTRALL